MLDIHDYNGQLAVKAAGLTDEFRDLALEGRQALRILDRDGTVRFEKGDDGTGGRPEVQRGELRELLINSLPAGTVQWGHKVDTAVALSNGQHEVTFTDGTSLRTDLLVGADGAWSRVRPLLSDAVPEYAGTSFVETYLYDADERHPATAQAVGGGSMFVPAQGGMLNAHRERGATLHTYVVLDKPEDWFAQFDFADSDATAARLVREFDGWAPELTALITDSDTPLLHRPHFTLPIGHRWDRVAGVTLIGDAAHLQAPDGEGANNAMLDGAELGQALAARPDDPEGALAEYEQGMFARMAVPSDGAEFMAEIFGGAPPESLTDLLG